MPALGLRTAVVDAEVGLRSLRPFFASTRRSGSGLCGGGERRPLQRRVRWPRGQWLVASVAVARGLCGGGSRPLWRCDGRCGRGKGEVVVR
jgi:hypothetical protein